MSNERHTITDAVFKHALFDEENLEVNDFHNLQDMIDGDIDTLFDSESYFSGENIINHYMYRMEHA